MWLGPENLPHYKLRTPDLLAPSVGLYQQRYTGLIMHYTPLNLISPAFSHLIRKFFYNSSKYRSISGPRRHKPLA